MKKNRNNEKPYRVLLFYKYARIENAETYTAHHLAFCRALGVRGRILIAGEGINGTISGTVAQTDAYMHAMRMDPRFEDMVFKIDEVDDHVFRKIFVRHRGEIVTLGIERDLDPSIVTGRHLPPAEFHEAMQGDDVVIVDVRNGYEYDLGHFRNAIRADVQTFKEFPEWVRENLAEHREKTVLTYCTGGIRCEKFTAYLLSEGFADVRQLEGGIVSYGKDPAIEKSLFEGKCYVFDERVSVPVGETTATVARCRHCGATTERMVNCANLDCDTQFLCCASCEALHRRSCSADCRRALRHEFTEEVLGEAYSFYR